MSLGRSFRAVLILGGSLLGIRHSYRFPFSVECAVLIRQMNPALVESMNDCTDAVPRVGFVAELVVDVAANVLAANSVQVHQVVVTRTLAPACFVTRVGILRWAVAHQLAVNMTARGTRAFFDSLARNTRLLTHTDIIST